MEPLGHLRVQELAALPPVPPLIDPSPPTLPADPLPSAPMPAGLGPSRRIRLRDVFRASGGPQRPGGWLAPAAQRVARGGPAAAVTRMTDIAPRRRASGGV